MNRMNPRVVNEIAGADEQQLRVNYSEQHTRKDAHDRQTALNKQ